MNYNKLPLLRLFDTMDTISVSNNKAMFQVPADIFCHSGHVKPLLEAKTDLLKLQRAWREQDIETLFYIWGEEDVMVWLPELKRETRTVIKIGACNDKIADFATNMNTVND